MNMKCQNKPMVVEVPEENYAIRIGQNMDEILLDYLEKYKNKKICIITDDTVYSYYKNWIEETFSEFNTTVFSFTAGEDSKTLETYQACMNTLLENEFKRDDLICAFGGGIPCDVAGFVAATYQRGIDFISVPTTVLSMVDASVGGKNGVNLQHLKNQVGTFYFPKYVHMDCKFLETLPEREIHSGMAEMIKCAVLADRELFDYFQGKETTIDWQQSVARCLEIKLQYVRGDVKDHGQRQFLNLGHTLGHAIEALSKHEISHGEAVGIGMLYIARAARAMGYTETNIDGLIEKALLHVGLPTAYEMDSEKAMAILTHDKKVRGDRIAVIIPLDIGHVIREEVDMKALFQWVEKGQHHE